MGRNGNNLRHENEVTGKNNIINILLGEVIECCTLDCESPIAKPLITLFSKSSNMRHMESHVYQQGQS